MKNKLILHIGTPKTGTTAIQKFLYDNQELLKEQGYSYPKIQDLVFPSNNGSPLRNYVKQGIPDTELFGWKEFWNNTRHELNSNHVIISYEEIFCYNVHQFISAVKKEYDNIKVIVYLRRQDRYMETIWNQCIKRLEFSTIEFKDFKEKRIQDLDYLEKLNKISQIVGKNNIIVRVYEKEQFQGKYHSVVSDFLNALGINLDWERCILDKPINMALFGNYLEIKRKMNYSFHKKDRISLKMEMIFWNYTQPLFSSFGIKHLEGMFLPEEREKFLSQYSEQNSEVAKKYLGRSDGVLFYDDKPIPMHKIDTGTLCLDIQKVFMTFFHDLEQGISILYSYNTSNILNEDVNLISKIQQLLNYMHDIKESMLKEVEKVQNKEFGESQFETACFQIVEEYTPKIVEIYRQKYKIYNHIRQYLQQKKGNREFYFFGTGGYCEDIIREIEIVPDAFLDNDREKAGLCIHQKQIFHPTQIQDWKNCFILITVKKPDIIFSIEQQLQKCDLNKYQDYMIAVELF